MGIFVHILSSRFVMEYIMVDIIVMMCHVVNTIINLFKILKPNKQQYVLV